VLSSRDGVAGHRVPDELAGRCELVVGGEVIGENGADVTQAGEYAVELRLVGDRDGEGGAAVVVPGQVGVAEPGRPVVVEVAIDRGQVADGLLGEVPIVPGGTAHPAIISRKRPPSEPGRGV
jgi:hypothetical protein